MLESEGFLNENQFGFRNERGTSQAIMTMMTVIEDAKHNEELHLCLIDFTKAFDSVDWDALFRIMEKKGFSNEAVNFIKKYLENRRIRLNTPVGKSGFFKVTRGTPQGDPLSTLFFLIFIDPLLNELDRAGIGYTFSKNRNIHISQIAFADDLALITKTNKDMQELLKIVNAFSEACAFPINPSKTISQ